MSGIHVTEGTYMLANDLLNTQQDLAVANLRVRELEAIVLLRDREIRALSKRLDRELSTKKQAACVIVELQTAIQQIGARNEC